jgi:hypothetical protein
VLSEEVEDDMGKGHNMNLQDFCGGDDYRLISKPVNLDGYAYATNGHIAVRVPGKPEYEKARKDHKWAKQLQGWLDDAIPKAKLSPLPDYEAPEPSVCFMCYGHKEIEDDIEVEEETPTIIPCPKCKGIGTTDEVPVRFGRVCVSHYYLKMLTALPGLLIDLTGGTTDRIYFIFHGGDGVVMPMKP